MLEEGRAPGVVPTWEMSWKSDAMNSVHGGRVGRWKESLTPREVGIMEAMGAEALEALGYPLETAPPRSVPLMTRLELPLRDLLWRTRHWWRETVRGQGARSRPRAS